MRAVATGADVRVVFAEDNMLLREGVVRLLGSADGVEVVGSCGTFDDLVALVAQADPDVVVTDIRMPPTGTDEGIRAANLFRDTHPRVGVVVLSQYADPAYALALLEQGSEQRAYLLKDRVSDIDQLVDAIRVVRSGGSVIDPKVVEELVAARARKPPSRLQHLTGRERDILHEMAQGRSNAAIASTLGLSERAVEKHSNSIFAKLHLNEEPDLNRRVKAVLVYLADGS
jgi:DNA-binding NarL/FixJ family response regulator